MFNKNSNWSKILIVVIVGLLMGFAIPIIKKMGGEKENFYINNNLKWIVAAGKRYMHQHGVTKVHFSELEDLYLEEIIPVAGEDYNSIQLEPSGVISLVTEDGRVIDYIVD